MQNKRLKDDLLKENINLLSGLVKTKSRWPPVWFLKNKLRVMTKWGCFQHILQPFIAGKRNTDKG